MERELKCTLKIAVKHPANRYFQTKMRAVRHHISPRWFKHCAILICLTIIAGCFTSTPVITIRGNAYNIGSLGLKKPAIEWEKIYGSGFFEEDAFALTSMNDGGYLLAGVRYGGVTDDRKERIYLTRIDETGDVQWDTTYWYNLEPTGVLSACERQNGNILLSGWYSEGGIFNSNIWELNDQRQQVWNGHLGKGGYYSVSKIIPSADSGFVAAGETTAGGGTGKNIFIAKFTSDNRLAWSDYSGGRMNDGLNDVIETPAHTYIAVGFTNSWAKGDDDAYIIHIDRDGSKIWSSAYGGYHEDVALSVTSSGDGGFVMAGYSKSYGNGEEIYIVKVDSLGILVWENTYGSKFDDRAQAIEKTKDGYIIAGYTETGLMRETDFYVFEIAETGEVLWESKFGYKNVGKARAIVQTADGGYIIAGITKPFYAKSDVYAVKVKVD